MRRNHSPLWPLVFLMILSACAGPDHDSSSGDAQNGDSDSGDDDTEPSQNDDADDDHADDDTGDDDTGVEPSSPLVGLWDVFGTDDLLGLYEGRVEFWEDEGELRFARSVQYSDQVFEGYEVYTGWEGEASYSEHRLTIQVSLRIADYIWKAGDLERSEADGIPVAVSGDFLLQEDGTLEGFYTSDRPAYFPGAAETMIPLGRGRGRNSDAPIFFMDDAYYESHPPVSEALHWVLFAPLADYHALAYYDAYRDREEFIEGMHFFPRFRTDFEWYRGHPGALRVANKVVDEISLREVAFPKDSFHIDRRIDPAWCASPLPSLFWKFDWADGGRHQGLTATPYFQRNSDSCFWKGNPLSVNSGPSNLRDNGADYLHAYWMARAYGVLGSDS